MAHATLTPEVEAVLRKSTITGNTLVLPPGQLDRKLYEAVNKVIVNCGGKWNKSAKGHVFPSDPSAKLGLGGTVLATGFAEDTKKTRQAFYTPAAVAARAVELADVDGHHVLEPSCGAGAMIAECLAQGAKAVIAQELDAETAAETAARFKGQPVSVQTGDFLLVKPVTLFSRIVANPPFSKNAAFHHFRHMLSFLAPKGVLVSVLPPLLPTNAAFLKATQGYKVTVEDVPEGAFKESGTNIRTVIVKVVAP